MFLQSKFNPLTYSGVCVFVMTRNYFYQDERAKQKDSTDNNLAEETEEYVFLL